MAKSKGPKSTQDHGVISFRLTEEDHALLVRYSQGQTDTYGKPLGYSKVAKKLVLDTLRGYFKKK